MATVLCVQPKSPMTRRAGGKPATPRANQARPMQTPSSAHCTTTMTKTSDARADSPFLNWLQKAQ